MSLQTQNTSRHVYLADDDDEDRLLFAEAMQEVDKSVILTEAENGRQLMNILTLPPDPLPEVVFLDINMPIENGFQCLERIRNDERDLSKLNIIIFSTSNNPQSIATAFGLGASFYAVKPNSFKGLKSLIENVLLMNWSYPGLIVNRQIIAHT